MHMIMTDQRNRFKVSQSIRSRESKGDFLISQKTDVAIGVMFRGVFVERLANSGDATSMC